MMGHVKWSEGTWTNPPVAIDDEGDLLRVTAAEGSDAWRHTAYGFVHDSEHALLAPFPVDSAMEVEFEAGFTEEFDQAGLFVRAGDERWMKSGVEFADGILNVGAVVTDVFSDWSVGPVPDWSGRRVRVRVSRGENALTLRAAAGDEPWRLVRVVPFAADLDATAGPFVCAPTRAGLTVTFTAWRRTAADTALH
jgi:regulation of enolase protein 1 (concanavalin A-like superfamily)